VRLPTPQLPPPQPQAGLLGMLKSKEAAAAEAWQLRRTFLRCWARKVLEALAFCHERGVAHCSLSPGVQQLPLRCCCC